MIALRDKLALLRTLIYLLFVSLLQHHELRLLLKQKITDHFKVNLLRLSSWLNHLRRLLFPLLYDVAERLISIHFHTVILSCLIILLAYRSITPPFIMLVCVEFDGRLGLHGSGVWRCTIVELFLLMLMGLYIVVGFFVLLSRDEKLVATTLVTCRVICAQQPPSITGVLRDISVASLRRREFLQRCIM